MEVTTEIKKKKMKIESVPVRFVAYLKKVFKCRTYHIEYVFTLTVLIGVAVISHKGPIEWFGVLAVFFTFCHTSVSDRLQEAEAHRQKMNTPLAVECYPKLTHFFYLKEVCWFAYFILLGAWSALVGVVLFLIYPYWRKLWRKYHPL